MHPFRVRMFIPAAGLALVLGACSGRGDDAAAAAMPPATPSPGVATLVGEPAVPKMESNRAAPGELQALLAKLPRPARNATEAVAQFHRNGEDPQPVGPQSGLDAQDALKPDGAAREQRLTGQDGSATAAILDAGLSGRPPRRQSAKEAGDDEPRAKRVRHATNRSNGTTDAGMNAGTRP